MQYEGNYKQLLMKSCVHKDLILYINTKSKCSIFMHTCQYRNGVVYIIIRILSCTNLPRQGTSVIRKLYFLYRTNNSLHLKQIALASCI